MPSQSILGTLPTQIPSAGSAPYLRGLELLGKGDLTGAENALNESLKIDPNLAEAYLVLAEVRLRQKKMAELSPLREKRSPCGRKYPTRWSHWETSCCSRRRQPGRRSVPQGAVQWMPTTSPPTWGWANCTWAPTRNPTRRPPPARRGAQFRIVQCALFACFRIRRGKAFSRGDRRIRHGGQAGTEQSTTAPRYRPHPGQPENFDAALESFTPALQASPTFLPP